MHRLRSGALLLTLLLAVALAGPAVAHAEEGPRFPYGEYNGSAASGDSGPVAVTLRILPAGEGRVKLSALVDIIPFPVSTTAVASPAGSGFDVPASVSMASLSGKGTLRFRQKGEQWVVYGEGSGSFNGEGGDGYGSAVRNVKSTLQEVEEAANAFISFGAVTEGPVPEPEKFPGDDDALSNLKPRSNPVDEMVEEGPSDGFAMLLIMLLWFLLLVSGLL